MDLFAGGYFLVQGVPAAGWMDPAWLPARLWTVSDCICPLHPDVRLYSWTNKTPQAEQEYRQLLGLDDESFRSLQAWADGMLDNGELGWPGVFMEMETARGFHRQHLSHLSGLKLLGIALSVDYWTEYVEKNKPEPGMGAGGVYQKLLQKQPPEPGALLRGFEILGDEWGGQFHSFLCNHLEKEYVEKLQITLNPQGLIDRYDDAVRAAAHTNREDVPAEPVLWQPWLVSEYPLSV